MREAGIRQRISDMEQEIALLRSNLPAPDDWTGPNISEGSSATGSGEPFIIQSETELELLALPDLARQILDALPIQIFIKRRTLDDVGRQHSGRKYLYLNQTARHLNNWTTEDVKNKHDSDVFTDDEIGRALYKKMQDQETATLDAGRPRITTTEWTQSASSWRRNQNIEIPILKANVCVALCSLANDIVFSELPQEFAINQKRETHHYSNLYDGIIDPLRTVLDCLTKLEASPLTLEDVLPKLRAEVLYVKQKISVAKATSKLQVEGLVAVGTFASAGHIEEIVSALHATYVETGIALTITDNIDQNSLLSAPKVVTAILTIFINNAIKHASVTEILLTCEQTGNIVSFSVINPCEATTKVPNVDLPERPKLQDVMEHGFDMLLIWMLTSNAFPGVPVKDIITFSKINDGHIHRFLANVTMEVVSNA